jgi:hypothetical protein
MDASSIRCASDCHAARVLESATLSNFERERDRIDGMGSRGGPKVAQNQNEAVSGRGYLARGGKALNLCAWKRCIAANLNPILLP